MARYYPISPLFWSDSKVRRWDSQERLMALYLLTCEHRNLEGLYRLPMPYVEADLGWTGANVRLVLDRLKADGFLYYDEESSVILIRKALKYHQPLNDRQITGAVNALQSVPDTALWSEFLECAREYAPELYTRLDTHTHSLSGGYLNGSITPEDTHA